MPENRLPANLLEGSTQLAEGGTSIDAQRNLMNRIARQENSGQLELPTEGRRPTFAALAGWLSCPLCRVASMVAPAIRKANPILHQPPS